jgi:hypothetical protein
MVEVGEVFHPWQFRSFFRVANANPNKTITKNVNENHPYSKLINHNHNKFPTTKLT